MSEPTATPGPDDRATPIPPIPKPRYGEYAPGFGPDGPLAGAAPSAPPMPAPPAPPAPTTAPRSGSAPYGTFVPVGPAAAVPPYGARPERRTWDLVLTALLLALGFLGMMLGLFYGITLSEPSTLDEAFELQGLDGFSGEIGSAPTILIVSHVGLWLLALAASVLALLKRAIAFWIPLSAGLIAGMIFWVTILTVFLSDPGFLDAYSAIS